MFAQTATTIHQEGIYIDNFKGRRPRPFRETELYDLLTVPNIRPATRCRRQRHEGADRRQRKGVQELRKMVGPSSACRSWKAYMEARPGHAAEGVSPRDRAAARQRLQLRDDQGCVIK